MKILTIVESSAKSMNEKKPKKWGKQVGWRIIGNFASKEQY